MLTGQTILVTGAGSGIGRQCAAHLSSLGAQVIVSDIDRDTGQAAVDSICKQGGQARFVYADVARADSVQALMQSIADKEGRLHGAVNNAGVEHPIGRLADYDEAVFDQTMAVNVKGVWLCMKYQIQHMLTQGGGQIVNLASVAGLRAAPSLSIYAGSKYAVVGLTRSAALEYARQGIRINAVCPAVIRTPMLERAMQHEPDAASAIEKLVQHNPMQRLGEPLEVAQMIAWLLSDQASFVTGAALPVDGGLTA